MDLVRSRLVLGTMFLILIATDIHEHRNSRIIGEEDACSKNA